VPTIALFGPTAAAQWAPPGKRHQALTGNPCGCDGNSPVCHGASHCLLAISPAQVFATLQNILRPG
jgi:ADP-heptose:LPS heptosyltransferase